MHLLPGQFLLGILNKKQVACGNACLQRCNPVGASVSITEETSCEKENKLKYGSLQFTSRECWGTDIGVGAVVTTY